MVCEGKVCIYFFVSCISEQSAENVENETNATKNACTTPTDSIFDDDS